MRKRYQGVAAGREALVVAGNGAVMCALLGILAS